MHGTPAQDVSTKQNSLRPEMRRQDLLDRDRDETWDAQGRSRPRCWARCLRWDVSTSQMSRGWDVNTWVHN